ncbi:cysteine proteinase [Epithele typhae]|uniref:cysteine proteinase n=1 Tax=Epithele typhae TaxID=378194 RepID=UPI002008D84E|nr:cysteine proteinase [Epithele typhae]KAH9911282.1 cysteine proteinase [Epithele typhae]
MVQDATPPSTLRKRATGATSDSRPSTPARTANRDAIDPATFYGTGTSNALGSSHTGYVAPEVFPFREPELVQDTVPTDPNQYNPPPTWGTESLADWSKEWGPVSTTYDDWGVPGTIRKISIDGRSEDEETHILHDPNHALYSVSPDPPPSVADIPPAHLPTQDEVRTAVPHPNAYFCREDNGWVFLQWRSSSVLPPLVDPAASLPNQARRKRTQSCVGDGEQPFGQANVTHHWHQYPKAVDATRLNPPYARSDLLLDLYLCCQCSTYCLVSDIIPGAIPAHLLNALVEDKLTNPAIDKTPRATVVAALETIQSIVSNRIWRDEQRVLPIMGARFKTKLGWDPAIEQIFKELGFRAEKTPKEGKPGELLLQPPGIDPATPEGVANRTKLLRAWTELSAWLVIYQKNKEGLADYSSIVLTVKADGARDMYQEGIGAHVSQISRGNLPDQLVGYAPLDAAWRLLGMTPSTYTWELLAFAYLAQCRCDPENTMTYFAQLMTIVNAMVNLGIAVPTELQALVMEERERSRFTPEDYALAACRLGFGAELGVDLDADVDDEFIAAAWRSARRRAWQSTGDATTKRAELNDALRIVAETRGSLALIKVWTEEKGSGMSPETAYSTLDVPRDVDESMLLTVFSMRIEDSPSQAERMREALGVIAEVTNSERLRQFLTTGTDPGDGTVTNSSPEMPRGLNQLGNTCYLNSLLQYFYTIKDLRDAIASLAGTGAKSLDEKKFTDDDLKRHRVGGRLVTRREILRSKKFVHLLAELFWNLEYCDTASVTPEIELAKLALVTSQDEEEDAIDAEMDLDKAGTDSSNDTDATLPEQGAQSPTGSVLGKRSRETDGEETMEVDTPAQSPKATGGSSPRGGSGGSEAAMFIEEAIASTSSTSLDKRPAQATSDGDVEMKEENQSSSAGKAPPLPPRKTRPTDDSVMMFGRQHDVSECMDNCMFQIETALLDFQGMATSDDDKTSPVKRLFYGKKRQRLIADDSRHQSSIHEKEDLFSHLHVNVADEGFDLYDGLARYFDDVVEVNGQKKRMEVTLVDLPPLLQIQLQRVQFNRDTQQAYKSQAYVKFGETIYMDRFLDSASPEKKARSKALQAELTAARDRVQRLTQGQLAPFSPALTNAANFLASQTALELTKDDALVASLRAEEVLISEELRVLRERLAILKQELEDIWRDETSAGYELTSVFIHRGSSPSWGHYFFYSRHLPESPEKWFKYNDSDVSAVAKEEVLADTTGSTANPYMLVFVRKGCDAIDTVHRFNPDLLVEGE